MKRILGVFAVLAAATVLVATQDPNHKISWCHFPPGLAPNKVLILLIDVAADGTIGPAHQNHQFDGPVCFGDDIVGPPRFECIPPNITYVGPSPLGTTCGGLQPCDSFTDGDNGKTVQPVRNSQGLCVCPSGTAHAGDPPVDLGGGALTCNVTV